MDNLEVRIAANSYVGDKNYFDKTIYFYELFICMFMNISGSQGGVKRSYNAISSKKSGNKGVNGGSTQRSKKPKVTIAISL